MIQINLLEQSQVRNRSRRPGAAAASGATHPSGSLLLALVVLLMVGLNAAVGWTLYQKVNHAGDQARRLRAEIKQVEDQIGATFQNSDQVRQFQEVLDNQKEVLRTLDPSDRLLWSEKINMLAALIPKDVFLSDINVSEVTEMIATEQSSKAHATWENADKRKRGPEPEIVKKPVIHYEVVLTGLATGRDSVEQFDNVLAFHRAMTTHRTKDEKGLSRRFMEGFVDNVDFGSIEATTYEKVPVNKFVFKLRTLNQGGENVKIETKSVAQSSDGGKTVATAR